MGDIFKEFLDKASGIIRESAQSPLGLVALSVLVLGIVGAFLFRNAAGKLKLAAFAMITAGLLGVIAFVFVSPSSPKLNQSLVQDDKTNPPSQNRPQQNSPKRTA
jgi:high-affinity Fe2+/Pb2+ permease